MSSLFRKVLILLYSFAVLSGVLSISYVLVFVLPHLQNVREIYHSISQKQKDFVILHQKIFVCLETSDEGDNKMSLLISRRLVSAFLSLGEVKVSHLKWHIHYFLWNRLLLWYFDEKDIVILYTYYMPFEKGYGMEYSAKFYFNKELTDLTIDDIVILISIARAPQQYSPTKHSTELHRLKVKLYKKLLVCQSGRSD